MQQPQLFFNKTLKTKKELKDLEAVIKDALFNSQRYQQIVEQIKSLNVKKRKLLEDIKMDFGHEAGKIDTLKLDIKNDKIILSDIVLNEMIKGKTVEVEDKNGIKYYPEFSVKFKQILITHKAQLAL